MDYKKESVTAPDYIYSPMRPELRPTKTYVNIVSTTTEAGCRLDKLIEELGNLVEMRECKYPRGLGVATWIQVEQKLRHLGNKWR